MTENEVAAVKGGDGSWDRKVLDDLSINKEDVPLPKKEDQKRYSTNPFLVDDYDSIYADRNVLDCDVPVMEVFYERDNVVKDICVDMGVPEKAKTVGYAAMNNHESVHGSDEEEQHRRPSIGCNNVDMFVSDETIACGRKESNGVKTVDQETLQMPSDVFSVEEKSRVGCDFEGSIKTCEELKSDTTPSYSSKIGSPLDKELGTEVITQRPLRSFLSLLEDERKETTQMPIIGQVSESSEASSLTCPDEDEEENSDGLYNRKVETESITFSFLSDPSSDKADDTTNEAVEALKRDTEHIDNLTDDPEQVLHSSDESGHNRQPQHLFTAEDVTKSVNLSEAEQAGPGEKQDESKNFDEEQSPESNGGKSTSVQSTASKSRSSPFQYDEGETSFSAASLAGFSGGPIPYSGSISHRSDASTTSARSFAFPVLQSEWNSSPVRMAKADGANFRKHNKGWRLGLFCCRF